MDNVKMQVSGDKLTIEIDLSANFGRSKSGKTVVIASSRGNVSVPDHPEVKIGLNCYKKA